MRPSEKDAKTYQDLMRLLPDVATIKLWWAVNEDGDPRYISTHPAFQSRRPCAD